jgi:type IV secretory pathway VirB2 component (pilin)
LNNILFSRVLAQTNTDTDFGDNVTGITDYINRILPEIYGIVAGLAVLMIIYAGYIYMTSQGNPERLGVAKDIIIGVITGIALLFLMGLILGTVGTP